MQQHAPEAVDFARKPKRRKNSTASISRKTADFGRKCLLARRLVERGVRFIQVYSGGAHNDDNWDAHSDMVKNHTKHAGDTDKPVAGLLKDLKRRGSARQHAHRLGRRVRPAADGRIRPGHRPRPQRLRLHDVAGRRRHQGRRQRRRDRRTRQRRASRTASTSSTCTPRSCNQMGLDPNKLSYFYGGLDQKLVGVEGAEPIKQLIS